MTHMGGAKAWKAKLKERGQPFKLERIARGLQLVHNFAQIARFAAGCGASIPDWLAQRFEGLDDDPRTRELVAASVAVEQCRVLNACGITDFHFYTLNRADLTYAICHVLGVRPEGAVAETQEPS